MTKKYWDIKVHIKNFAANTALEASTLHMIAEKVVYRRGKINSDKINIENLEDYSFYDIEYVDLVPQDMEATMTNMMDWFLLRDFPHYSISLKNIKNKFLEGNIRFYSLQDAFEFRMFFNDYIIIEKKETV